MGYSLAAGVRAAADAQAWLVAFDGAKAVVDVGLSGSEARGLLAVSNDVQVLAGARQGRAWLARVKQGAVAQRHIKSRFPS